MVILTMNFAFYTFGCKVNQYETQAMEQLLRSWGHEICTIEDAWDGCIINTCSVTAVADRKNRTLIRRLRSQRPQAVLAVCGCYSQQDPQAVQALGVDVVGGSSDREAFLRAVLEALRDRMQRTQVDEALRRRSFEVLPPGGLEERTRAMLKVQDGCANFCTYCIIPYTRGPVRSAPLETVLEQLRLVSSQGYREVVVTGIEIASWGRDLPGKPTAEVLICALCEEAPDMRIRLGSLEPRIVTESFCQRLSEYPNLCPQFHLSMQSGCDGVLKAMGRKYDTARYLQSVTLLRRFFPGCAITTDMIVAFPGETEEQFAESLRFIQKCAFADMHIFPYSRRPGTPADKMPGQHSNATKAERSRRAMAVAEEMGKAYLESQVGSIQNVLFEEASGPYFAGHSPNYCKVYARGEDLHNEIRRVRIDGLYRDGLLGQLL